jgi:hypothetical protein
LNLEILKLNFELLQQLLPERIEFANSQRFPEQLFSVNGFDEATAVAEQLRGIQFPAVLIEETGNGYIGYAAGFCDHRTVSIWVLQRAADISPAGRKQAYLQTFDLGKEILRLLVRANADYNGAGHFIDFTRTAYIPRGPIAQNVFGHEFLLAVSEEIDLNF